MPPETEGAWTPRGLPSPALPTPDPSDRTPGEKALAMEESTDLDSSVRAAVLELQSRDFPNPEVLLLLGTGVDETSAPLSEPTEVSLSDLPEVPRAWRDAQLIAGRSGDVRVWACTDAPESDATPWARAWPIWLA